MGRRGLSPLAPVFPSQKVSPLVYVSASGGPFPISPSSSFFTPKLHTLSRAHEKWTSGAFLGLLPLTSLIN